MTFESKPKKLQPIEIGESGMFNTHILNDTGLNEMRSFKMVMANTAKMVQEQMPEGREKSIFMTKMEEAVFFGAKAISGKKGNYAKLEEY